MPFAAAVSVHPVSAHATGEVIGRVVEDLGTRPDVAIVLVTTGHAGALEDVSRTIRTLLKPAVLIGAAAPAVLGEGASDERGPGMVLWAGLTGPVVPLRVAPESLDRPPLDRGMDWPTEESFPAAGAVVFGDQATCSGPRLVSYLEHHRRGLPVSGALTARGPLVLDDRCLVGGAVGVVLGKSVRFDVVVGRGWRPIGPRLVVTEVDAERSLIRALDGIPALPRLERLATDEVPAAELALINQDLGIGSATSVLDVRGADRSNGAIAVAGAIATGTEVHFWVRDDPGADLRRVLQGHQADTAMAFVADPERRGYTGGGRHDGVSRDIEDRDTDDHDAAILMDALGIPVVTGMVAPSQIGPVGGRLRALHADASVALFADR